MTKLSKKEQKEVLEELDSIELAKKEFFLYGPEGSQETQILEGMAIRNRVRRALLNTDEAPLSAIDSKSITTRLSFEDFSKLKVLSNHLNMSHSKLAKSLVIDGLSEAINAYFEVKGDDSVPDFAENVQELSLELHIEAKENAQ